MYNRVTVKLSITSFSILTLKGEARKLDAQDPKPGYLTQGTSPGFDSVGTLGGWAPGLQPYVLPDGVGYQLPKGADIVLQVHYYRTGHTERDQSRVGLYFSKTEKTTKLHVDSAINTKFVIPAGEKRYGVNATKQIKKDSYLLATMPHMHLLGRDMRIIAHPPTGKPIDLIWIQDWDFNWQDIYYYSQPIFLPVGTRISLVAHYDNSKDNPTNPHNPPIPVGWGDKTTDEMCIGFLYFVDATKYQPEE